MASGTSEEWLISMRVFLGIPLSEDAREEIEIIAQNIRGARWIPKENLHLTLNFLGELAPSRIEDLINSLNRIFHPPTTLDLKGVGHFPPRGEVHTLWVGAANNEIILQLKKRIDFALRQLEIPVEQRKFIPHITIARVKGCDNSEIGRFIVENNLFKHVGMPVNEFHLYSSHKQHPFPEYRIEATFPLSQVNSPRQNK